MSLFNEKIVTKEALVLFKNKVIEWVTTKLNEKVDKSGYEANKLLGTDGEGNVVERDFVSQPDWNEADESAGGFIKNKPLLVGENVEGKEYIVNEEGVVAGVGAEVFNDYVNNKATKKYSHAEGTGTTASGSYSHAEGSGTIASGNGSHAEGYNTTASGNCVHVEGNGTIASLNSAHAEGYCTVSGGIGSHSEGYKTTASGYYSHSEGCGTIASGNSQHVQGQYNIEDVSSNKHSRSTYCHIVGNGADKDTRSNAHTLDWDGNAWYAGNVSVGTLSSPILPTADNDLITKKYFEDNSSNLTFEEVKERLEGEIATAMFEEDIVTRILYNASIIPSPVLVDGKMLVSEDGETIYTL